MDLMPIIIAAILTLAFAGVLIGLYFALRGRGKAPDAPKSTTGGVELVEIARLERDKTTEMLMVVVDGKLYASASSLSFPQRMKVVSAANDLQKWLGLPVNAETPSTASTDIPPISAPSAAAQTMQAAIPAGPLKPVSTNPVESIRHSLTTNQTVPSFKSITVQIDEVLQSKIVGTEFEKRGIHLIESPNSGVIVQVGLEQYAGIDAVKDDEIRNLIRAAVTEWEKRNR